MAIQFLYRDGCHLCTEMATVIHNLWPGLFEEIQWVDIDSETELREKYGLKIPVLLKNKEIVCESLINIESLTSHFGQPSSTV